MKFSLLDNAVDSLRSTFISLGKITELIDGQDHHIKDAILSLNHANELLFKYLLKKDREYLVFKDLNSYMKAKEDMKKRDKKNIFEVALTFKLWASAKQ
ncbi:glycogen/starch/alpha-glucan phosphorylase [Bacillus paralicheniformis]|nr:glycogen/starch/alpha-glucan phosphorylase [Bacillus paralicheniformis]